MSYCPLPVRFWSKVRKAEGEGCWLWQGARGAGGYGQIGVWRQGPNGRRVLVKIGAHRVAWELTNGSVADGLHVLHRCDTPACVRPDHLFLGTSSDNGADMVAKGRARGGGWHGPLPDDVVLSIRRLCDFGVSQAMLARALNLHQTTVNKIATGVRH